MIHIILPTSEHRPLPFYLALEEVAARHFDEECFFTWVVDSTVIFGRNQVMQNEVNIGFCRENDIQLVRRKSGGGCVYADEGNIMMSYITPTNGNKVEDIFKRYLEKVAQALEEICALRFSVSGRNDILLDNRKISGSALYLTPDKHHTIAHGTFLHSTDINRMMNAITPSAEKLAAKGVASVRQRVVNLTEKIQTTIPDLRSHLAAKLCDKTFCATPEIIAETETLMQDYLDPAWIRGKDTGGDDALF